MVGAGSSPPVVFVPPVWGSTILPVSRRWRASAVGEGVCVVAGQDSATGRAVACYSLDNGQHWTVSPTAFPDTSGYGFNGKALAYGNGVFLGGLNAATTLKSLDGISWTPVGAGIWDKTALFFAPVAGVFVNVTANSNTIKYSADGTTWTPETLPSSNTWCVGAEDESTGTLIIGNNDGSIRKPSAGSWSAQSAFPWAPGTTAPNYMAAGNGKVVVTSLSSNTRVAYSANDGVTWQYSSVINAVVQNWGNVSFVDGFFYLMNSAGNLAYYSEDGNTWTAVSAASGLIGAQDWAQDAAVYVSCGDAGSNNYVVGYAPAGPAAPVNQLPALSLDTTTSASSSVTLTGDGKLEITGTGSTVAAPANWFNLQKYNIGVSYWVRLTVLSEITHSLGMPQILG